MRFDELRKTITGSTAGDWEQVGGGPMFIHALGEARSGTGERWVTVGYHHSLAVWNADVSLRLAWGLEDADDLTYPGFNFADPKISRSFADAFWQGALVARWSYLIVDGGRCYLPDSDAVYDGRDEHPHDSSQWTLQGYKASASDVAIARLLNNLVGRSEHGLFERYMGQANISEVPD